MGPVDAFGGVAEPAGAVVGDERAKFNRRVDDRGEHVDANGGSVFVHLIRILLLA
jgi:hypothetical protein